MPYQSSSMQPAPKLRDLMRDLNLKYKYGSASSIRHPQEHTIIMRGSDQEEWAHELGHYLMSTPKNRQKENLGMGEGVIDPIPGWSKINAYKNEVGACVISFALMHWAGCRLERPTKEFSRWDFDHEDDNGEMSFRGDYGLHLSNTAYIWNSPKSWAYQPHDFNTAFWIGVKTAFEKGFIFKNLKINIPRVLKEKFVYVPQPHERLPDAPGNQSSQPAGSTGSGANPY